MADSNGSQDRFAIPVHDWCLIGAQLTHPAGAFDLLGKLQGPAGQYHSRLRLFAGFLPVFRIIRGNAPDIAVVPPGHILPVLTHHGTERLIHLDMGPVYGLEPEHVRQTVNGSVQIGLGHI